MANETSNDAQIYTFPLGAREVQLLAEWERERRTSITLEDVEKRVGPDTAKYVVRELARKGALLRLRRGSYLVRPLRSFSRPTLTSTPVAVAALLKGEPYYLGGLWAVSLHRLSSQRYATVIDAFVSHRLAPRQLGAGEVHFHAVPPERLGYGVVTTQLEGFAVRHSDLERTLLDGLDHPKLSGGLARSLPLLVEHLRKAEPTRLIHYASLGSRTSTCQRLGVLLQRRGLTSRALAPLRAKARRTRSLLSMLPDQPRTGPVNRDWNVVENDG